MYSTIEASHFFLFVPTIESFSSVIIAAGKETKVYTFDNAAFYSRLCFMQFEICSLFYHCNEK